MRLAALMTVYNEADFIAQAIESCIDHVDELIIIEGSYQEMIDIGASPRSNDGTIEIIKDLFSVPQESVEFHLSRPSGASITFVQANEKTDKDQRNVGLALAKEAGADWLLIIDGDEVYEPRTFQQIKALCNQFDKAAVLGCYFTSLTFVNDFEHYTLQEFPRLFRVTSDCQFTNDNFMEWGNIKWQQPVVTKMPQIKYHHYAFCKGTESHRERFLMKKRWWETRFGDKKFEYDWYLDENGKIYSPNHKIYTYTRKHPEIMKEHPMYRKGEEKQC